MGRVILEENRNGDIHGGRGENGGFWLGFAETIKMGMKQSSLERIGILASVEKPF